MHQNVYRDRTGLIWSAVILFLFCGCAKKTWMYQPTAAEPMAEQAAPIPSMALSKAPPAVVPEPSADLPAPAAEPARARMVHHDGTISLRTPRPMVLVDAASRIVESSGGYVEKLDGETTVFRVPLETFQKVFDQLLGLGDVLDHSITTEDITDAFMDVDLRLTIARRTRRRLADLLARAKSDKEKIRILREIQRVSIQIETLSAQKERLLSMARYSRITLHIETRRLARSDARHEEIAAFEWIGRLWPFDDQVARSGKPLALKVPERMVALENKGLWVAESADGAFVRASVHKLQPQGDTAFWLQAVRLRLSPDYADASILDVGHFKMLRLEDRSASPFVYLVGLRVDPRQALEVVEIYFPTPAHETRYKAAVFSAIAGGAR
jgi:hypothetical protein